MVIEWKNVDSLSDGHGVLFIYIRLKKAIAFIVGYEWLHGRPGKVTVETLRKNSPIFSQDNVNGGIAIEGVKRTVVRFLERKKCSPIRSKDYRVWFNG